MRGDPAAGERSELFRGNAVKAAGTVLVLLGGWGVWRQYTGALRRETALLRDLAAALSLLAGEIRWRRIPLPQGIGQLSGRKQAGPYFSRVCRMIESGYTLQNAWEKVFAEIPWPWASILCRMEWTGDSLQLQRSLLWTAERLGELEKDGSGALHRRSQLCAAAAASAAGLLVLILL